ncbi:MAG: hypothetical protein JXR68_06115 [Bacteroidales bacterium]|nr:hypothetical protein [Bacteroidales bacterium]
MALKKNPFLFFDKFNVEDINIGGFKYSTRNKIKEAKEKIITDTIKDMSVIQQIYLDKIKDYCFINNIKLYFVVTPLHECYKKISETTFDSLMKTKYSDIEILDYSAFFNNDSVFSDLEHLNYKGAKILTTYFIKELGRK